MIYRFYASLLIPLLIITLFTGCAELAPPLTTTEIAEFTGSIAAEIDQKPAEFSGLLTPEEAVSRAILFNRDIRVAELEGALAEARVRAQNGSVLPSLVGSREYFRRDQAQKSHSDRSSDYSSSSDVGAVTTDMTLSWNILDFGLSFVRAKQGYDKVLQQQEAARRVSVGILQDTRATYWRAVAQRRLMATVNQLESESDDALRLSRQAATDPRIDPMNPIDFQRDLLTLRREINQLQASLAGANDQLKLLTGLPPASQPELLKQPASAQLGLVLPEAADDVAAALAQRPELRSIMYDMRINQAEVEAKLLELLPGVTLTASASSDSNSYLLNSNWLSWGSKIASNLINLARLPADLDAIDAEQQVNRERALAMAASIVMQVHVSRARLLVDRKNYDDAKRYAGLLRQLLQQVEAAAEQGRAGQQVVVREKLSVTIAEVRALLAFADLHAAFGAYLAAKGEE